MLPVTLLDINLCLYRKTKAISGKNAVESTVWCAANGNKDRANL